MGDCIRGPRPCQGIKLSRAHKCCRKACRAWPAGVMRGVWCAVCGALCAARVSWRGPAAPCRGDRLVAPGRSSSGMAERRACRRARCRASRQRGAGRKRSRIRSFAHPPIRSPIRPPQTTPRRRTPKFGAAVARHHFGTKAAPTRRAPTMARSPISAIWQTLYGAAVRRHRPPSRGGLGSPPRPSSLERSYAAHTARESAVRNPAFSR